MSTAVVERNCRAEKPGRNSNSNSKRAQSTKTAARARSQSVENVERARAERRHRYISELHIDLQCALLTHPPDTKIRFAVRLTIATGKLDLPPQKKKNKIKEITKNRKPKQ